MGWGRERERELTDPTNFILYAMCLTLKGFDLHLMLQFLSFIEIGFLIFNLVLN